MDRNQRQAELLELVGHVLRPLRVLCASPDKFTAVERQTIRAQFLAEMETLQNQLRQFCNDGEVDYVVEWGDIADPCGHLRSLVREHLLANPQKVALNLDPLRRQLHRAIAAVPNVVPPTIYEARTPFTTYVKLRSLFASAATAVTFIDRYVDAHLFHRFFAAIDESVQLTVLTWPRSDHSKPGQVRYDGFIDVSRMFAKERPTTYRLLVRSGIHDRWLRFDGHLYHSGASTKDAGVNDSTLSLIDSADNHGKVDDVVASATELFGPATAHP
jgi:hypothetical protein